MEALRRSVAAANRQVLVLAGGLIGASILLALLLGFVISWSFILPVRSAHAFLRQVADGAFRSADDTLFWSALGIHLLPLVDLRDTH